MKRRRTVKKIKPIALAIIELRLFEGIRQLDTVLYLVSQQKISLNNFVKKFRSNFLKAFQVDLKACLGLVLPKQYCPIVI